MPARDPKQTQIRTSIRDFSWGKGRGRPVTRAIVEILPEAFGEIQRPTTPSCVGR